MLPSLKILELKESQPAEFVDHWKKAYDGKFDDEYSVFMNPNVSLSSEYVLRACQWKKDRKWREGVTPENFGNTWSKYIKKWMHKDSLEYLEGIRQTGVNSSTLFDKLAELGTFQTVRMQSFIAHTVRPFDFPILDQNVWRSYVFLKEHRVEDKEHTYTSRDYNDYKEFFDSLALEYEREVDDSGATFKQRLRKRKDVDDALMAFGWYLNKFGMLHTHE